MAEERNDILMTPVRTMSVDSYLRNSTGKTSTSGSSKKILPHYLRASTGSCHDFCKYGWKHAIEAKGKRRIPKRVTTTAKDSLICATVSQRKKKPSVKLRPFLDSKNQLPSLSEIIKQISSSDKEEKASSKQIFSPAKRVGLSPRQVSSPAKKIEVSPKQAVSPAKKIEVPQKQAVSPARKLEVSPKQELSSDREIDISPKRALSSAKEVEISPKQALSSAKEIDILPKQAFSSAKKIEISPKQALLSARKIEIFPKQAVSSARKIEISQKPAVSSARKIEISPKQALSSAMKVEVSPKRALPPAKKLEASAKKTSFPAKGNNSSPEPGSPLKPKSVAAKPSAPSGLSGGLGGNRNSDIKIVKKMASSKIDEKKALRPPIASVPPKPSVSRVLSSNTRKYKIAEKKALRPPIATVSAKPSISRVLSLNTRKYRNVKAVSPLKNQNKVKKAEPKLPISHLKSRNKVKKVEQKLSNAVKEKTLYVIEQPESKSLELAPNGTHITRSSPSPSSSSSLDSSSSQSSPLLYPHVEEDNEVSESMLSEDNEESESMLSESDYSVSEYDETENENQFKTLNMEDRKSGRGAVHSENTDCPPRKLKFRRGSIVDIQTENNVPRRLKFRQGRLLGENDGKGGVGRKSFRRRREVTDCTKPESVQVILRHQDVQGKKDALGLFNNVIEETASKLVESRKSKVKALVGAFETVISLQESKPSTS